RSASLAVWRALLTEKLLDLLQRALGILQVVASAFHVAVLKGCTGFLQNIVEPDGSGFHLAAEAEALLLDTLFDGAHTSLSRGSANRYPIDTIAQFFQFRRRRGGSGGCPGGGWRVLESLPRLHCRLRLAKRRGLSNRRRLSNGCCSGGPGRLGRGLRRAERVLRRDGLLNRTDRLHRGRRGSSHRRGNRGGCGRGGWGRHLSRS